MSGRWRRWLGPSAARVRHDGLSVDGQNAVLTAIRSRRSRVAYFPGNRFRATGCGARAYVQGLESMGRNQVRARYRLNERCEAHTTGGLKTRPIFLPFRSSHIFLFFSLLSADATGAAESLSGPAAVAAAVLFLAPDIRNPGRAF